ncbi:PaaI family thioesterase [Campylobacter coli]|uniref:PaaI family thioesterase n=1 Tax=Campylobacter coli TaxID=195 RepID=UPI00139BEF55|nr:PaaI family thioesterase [Campylobacter coli]EDO6665782.1 PaaI family thioesterase [Campylobacter coli]EDO6913643.1 PaaI family thioesterase [Campylobacter coli]HED7905878.1 PaaI family thioesterase [Campylobacter coli]HED7917167.1 PaaI family thioesterase [Campylobacter coli]HED7919074.1 PaaI family thioesterase [Campylobacter coli]
MAKKDIFEEYAQLEEYASAEDISRVRAELLTCPELNTSLAGTIIELDKNFAKSILITTGDMVVDEQGLVFDAFIFAAANYVAQASINKEFSVVIGSKCFFYAPLKLGDVLELEAHALFDETSKKRDVKVVGHVKEIKMFEATIQVVSIDEHIFKLKRPPLNTAKAAENPDSPTSTVNPEAIGSALSVSLRK